MMPAVKISLADQIRDKLHGGFLPRALPEKMWAGYGHDNPCDGCGQPMLPAQVEYEFKTLPNSDHVFPLHIGCLGIWIGELRRRGLVEPTG